MEFLIRVHDSATLTGDDAFDSKVSRRGDVIVALEDGHAWSHEELSNPNWRILKLPNISAAMAATFLDMEIDTTGAPRGNPLLQFRGFKVNVDHPLIPADLAAYIADDTRVAPTFTSSLADTGFNTFKFAKPIWSTYKLTLITQPAVANPL